MSLYGSVPLVQSIGVNGSFGFFWMNAAETWVDVEKVSGGGDSMVGSLLNSVFNSGGSDYIDTHWMSGTVSIILIFPYKLSYIRVCISVCPIYYPLLFTGI